MGGQGGHRTVTGLMGQERSAVFSHGHGHGSSERERLRHARQPSFHKSLQSENRLQARVPVSRVDGLQGRSIAVVGPDQTVPTRHVVLDTQMQGQPRALPCGRGDTEYVSLGHSPGPLCHLQRGEGLLCGPW